MIVVDVQVICLIISKSSFYYFFSSLLFVKMYIGGKVKVLTIKEPWASLIINGYKKYEFRSWKTNYRGKILIHAGMSLECEMLERFKDYDLNCVKGAIIGEADIVDCIKVTEEFNKELRCIDPTIYGRSNHVETYAWKLENIIKYEAPIYVKGKLGLWNYGGNNET